MEHQRGDHRHTGGQRGQDQVDGHARGGGDQLGDQAGRRVVERLGQAQQADQPVQCHQHGQHDPGRLPMGAARRDVAHECHGGPERRGRGEHVADHHLQGDHAGDGGNLGPDQHGQQDHQVAQRLAGPYGKAGETERGRRAQQASGQGQRRRAAQAAQQQLRRVVQGGEQAEAGQPAPGAMSRALAADHPGGQGEADQRDGVDEQEVVAL
jgi:hypothetical protein